MRIGLLVSMFDEINAVEHNLMNVGDKFARVVVVHAGLPNKRIAEQLTRLDGQYLTTVTDVPPDVSLSRWTDWLATSFSFGFRQFVDVDYVVAQTGDTYILYIDSIYEIIEQMRNDQVACSRAIGRKFPKAAWTREQMADPKCPKDGRVHDLTNKDFMSEMWIVSSDMIQRLKHIRLTNPWSIEQCLGDAIGDARQYVFNHTAFGRAIHDQFGNDLGCYMHDGIVYKVSGARNVAEIGRI